MWRIAKVGVVTRNGEVLPQLFQVLSENYIHSSNIVIHLTNTETGDYEVMYSLGNENFMSKLRTFNPFGYINNNGEDCSNDLTVDDIAMVIDDLSWQMISYVDTIGELIVEPGSELYDFASQLTGSFKAVNKSRTLFSCGDIVSGYCTLFHAMLYSPAGWLGDDFYLYSIGLFMDGQGSLTIGDRIYCIKFKDAQGAKRLMTKALVSDINPMRDYQTNKFLNLGC